MLRLKVVAKADLDALVHVLQCLRAPNVVPLRVTALLAAIGGRSTEVLEIEIDFAASDLAPEALRLIAAKINQLPVVLTTAIN